jgi:hypothetical protein
VLAGGRSRSACRRRATLRAARPWPGCRASSRCWRCRAGRSPAAPAPRAGRRRRAARAGSSGSRAPGRAPWPARGGPGRGRTSRRPRSGGLRRCWLPGGGRRRRGVRPGGGGDARLQRLGCRPLRRLLARACCRLVPSFLAPLASFAKARAPAAERPALPPAALRWQSCLRSCPAAALRARSLLPAAMACSMPAPHRGPRASAPTRSPAPRAGARCADGTGGSEAGRAGRCLSLAADAFLANVPLVAGALHLERLAARHVEVVGAVDLPELGGGVSPSTLMTRFSMFTLMLDLPTMRARRSSSQPCGSGRRRA